MSRKISFKKGTAGYAERRRIAEGIARENPGIDMASKFKIATAAVKREKKRRGSSRHGRPI